MMVKFITAAFILFLSSCSILRSSITTENKLEAEIELLRKKFNVPGASIAIIDNSKIVDLWPFGLANIEKKIPVTKHSLFQACSITKTLTSALVLKLLAEKKISLDSPANYWLRRWKIPGPYADKVTIRMLLNHTAAISNPYPDGGKLHVSKIATLPEHFLGLPPAVNPPLTVLYEPGAKFSYCNGCYAILQMLVEDLSGEDYPKLMSEKFLDPLAMAGSTFDHNLLDDPKPNIALNYDDNLKPHPPIRKMPIYATGSLTTTARDLAIFLRSIQEALQNNPRTILTHEQALLMVEPSSSPTRALGFFIGNKFGDEEKGGKYFFHAGQNVGYLALLIGSLDGKVGAVVLINISSPWDAKDFPHFKFIMAAIKAIASYYNWQ